MENNIEQESTAGKAFLETEKRTLQERLSPKALVFATALSAAASAGYGQESHADEMDAANNTTQVEAPIENAELTHAREVFQTLLDVETASPDYDNPNERQIELGQRRAAQDIIDALAAELSDDGTVDLYDRYKATTLLMQVFIEKSREVFAQKGNEALNDWVQENSGLYVLQNMHRQGVEMMHHLQERNTN